VIDITNTLWIPDQQCIPRLGYTRHVETEAQQGLVEMWPGEHGTQ